MKTITELILSVASSARRVLRNDRRIPRRPQLGIAQLKSFITKKNKNRSGFITPLPTWIFVLFVLLCLRIFAACANSRMTTVTLAIL